MGRPIAMKLAFILFTLLLCAGCGGTKSTQTPAVLSPTSWVGTWSGQVNWTGATPSDSLSMTISAPVTYSAGETMPPPYSGYASVTCPAGSGTCYMSQFTGTDTGNQCAQNGPITLVGSVLTVTSSYGTNSTTVQAYQDYAGGSGADDSAPTCNSIASGENWLGLTLNTTSITISGEFGGTGTLTQQ